MSRLAFTLDIEPPRTTAQERRVAVIHGKPMFYDPPKIKQAKALLRIALRKYRPDAPFSGAVCLIVLWKFPIGRHKDGELKTTKPDTDNLQKMLKDCMTAEGFWIDDAQVAVEKVIKTWSVTQGIEIQIEEIEKCSEERK